MGRDAPLPPPPSDFEFGSGTKSATSTANRGRVRFISDEQFDDFDEHRTGRTGFRYQREAGFYGEFPQRERDRFFRDSNLADLYHKYLYDPFSVQDKLTGPVRLYLFDHAERMMRDRCPTLYLTVCLSFQETGNSKADYFWNVKAHSSVQVHNKRKSIGIQIGLGPDEKPEIENWRRAAPSSAKSFYAYTRRLSPEQYRKVMATLRMDLTRKYVYKRGDSIADNLRPFDGTLNCTSYALRIARLGGFPVLSWHNVAFFAESPNRVRKDLDALIWLNQFSKQPGITKTEYHKGDAPKIPSRKGRPPKIEMTSLAARKDRADWERWKSNRARLPDLVNERFESMRAEIGWQPSDYALWERAWRDLCLGFGRFDPSWKHKAMAPPIPRSSAPRKKG